MDEVDINYCQKFKNELLDIYVEDFENLALELFKYQARFNSVYSEYIKYRKVDINRVIAVSDIPFMPIEFFKSHDVMTNTWKPERVFMSSGTTGADRSRHYIKDSNFYDKITAKTFEEHFGSIEGTAILALLPSYIQQGNSSLVHMIDHFIQLSEVEASGFYLDDLEQLSISIGHLLVENKKVVLFGVTYALLDLAEQFPGDFSSLIIIETGGMKGRRAEIIRSELYETLKRAFQVNQIYSEYGMTELLSQAYTTEEEIFQTPAWMRVYTRDINDPFRMLSTGNTGGLNIIDMANIDTCAFLETKDIGTCLSENRFKVLGRFDNSDIRGCNLMVH